MTLSSRRRFSSSRSKFPWLLVLALMVLPVGIGGCNMAMRSTSEVITAEVTEKERITSSQGGGYYLIFTETETFKIEDSYVYFNFGGSDTYGRIKKGKTYRFTVYGWRLPFMSSYRNMISAEEVGK